MKKNERGFTFVEGFITIAIFLFMFSALVYALNFCGRYTNMLSRETDIQRDMRRACEDLSAFITNTTWDHFLKSANKGIYYFAEDYRHPLLIESAMKDNGSFDTDSTFKPYITKYVLYYLIRPPYDTCSPQDKHTADEPSPIHNSGTKFLLRDPYCPHKWLIRREIDPYALRYSVIILPMIEGYLVKDLNNTGGGDVFSSKVIARNILDFEVIPPGEQADGDYTIYYNGAEKKTKDKSLKIRLISFKDKRFFRGVYSNQDLLSSTKDLFVIEKVIEPLN